MICSMFLSSLALRNTASLFTGLAQPIFSNAIFQNIQGISELASKVSKFQHYTKPFSE